MQLLVEFVRSSIIVMFPLRRETFLPHGIESGKRGKARFSLQPKTPCGV